MKTLHIEKDKVVAITLAGDSLAHKYGSVRVEVADETVAWVGMDYDVPALLQDVPGRGYLGDKDARWLVDVHRDIAAGKASFDPGATVRIEGAPFAIYGSGTSARFQPFVDVKGLGASPASAVDPMTAQFRMVGPVALRTATGMASWLALNLVDTSKIPSITKPLGRYYIYLGTDHNTRGGIRLMFADALEGPWKLYRPGLASGDDTILYEDLDTVTSWGATFSTETPFIVYDPVLQRMRMFYHCQRPSYGGTPGTKANPTDPLGAANAATSYGFQQGTMCALQAPGDESGVSFTKDRTFQLLTPTVGGPLGAGDHTGYLSMFKWRGRWVAHHLLGGTDTGLVGRSESFDADISQFYTSWGMTDSAADVFSAMGLSPTRISWLGVQPHETAGGPVITCTASTPASGGAVAEQSYRIAARIDGGLTRIIGYPRIFDVQGASLSNYIQMDDGRLGCVGFKNITGDSELYACYLG